MSDSVSGRFPVAKNLAVEELLKAYDNILPEVDEALAEANITSQLAIPKAPNGLEAIVLYGVHGDPFPPEDLTEVDSPILGKLFTFLHNWANYVQSEMTRSKSMLDVQNSKNTIVRSALKLYYNKERQVPAGMLDDYINTDERMVKLDVASEKLKAYYKAVESRYEQLKRSLNNVSREQTRRGEEFDREIHSERSGGKVPAGAFRR